MTKMSHRPNDIWAGFQGPKEYATKIDSMEPSVLFRFIDPHDIIVLWVCRLFTISMLDESMG